MRSIHLASDGPFPACGHPSTSEDAPRRYACISLIKRIPILVTPDRDKRRWRGTAARPHVSTGSDVDAANLTRQGLRGIGRLNDLGLSIPSSGIRLIESRTYKVLLLVVRVRYINGIVVLMFPQRFHPRAAARRGFFLKTVA